MAFKNFPAEILYNILDLCDPKSYITLLECGLQNLKFNEQYNKKKQEYKQLKKEEQKKLIFQKIKANDIACSAPQREKDAMSTFASLSDGTLTNVLNTMLSIDNLLEEMKNNAIVFDENVSFDVMRSKAESFFKMKYPEVWEKLLTIGNNMLDEEKSNLINFANNQRPEVFDIVEPLNVDLPIRIPRILERDVNGPHDVYDITVVNNLTYELLELSDEEKSHSEEN